MLVCVENVGSERVALPMALGWTWGVELRSVDGWEDRLCPDITQDAIRGGRVVSADDVWVIEPGGAACQAVAPGGTDCLFWTRHVPAGDYRIVVWLSGEPIDEVSVRLGSERTENPWLAALAVAGLPGARVQSWPGSDELRLPARVFGEVLGPSGLLGVASPAPRSPGRFQREFAVTFRAVGRPEKAGVGADADTESGRPNRGEDGR